jgi:glycosyltransferase involved in cell wall biosynthesis
LARSTHVITVSASEEASLLRHYPRLVDVDRVTVARNGGGEAAVGAQVSLDPATLLSSAPNVPAIKVRPQMCLFVGSLTKRKNGPGLIRAAVELVDKLDVEFIIVGATSSNFEGFDLDVPNRVRDRIIFLGQVNEPERIEELYRRARVLVFPSFYEASPLPPVEAMSFGCPVVCSEIRSLRERCGDAAAYCDPNDVTSIVDQVTRVLSDQNLALELQQLGLRQAASFTWEQQVNAVIEVLRRA